MNALEQAMLYQSPEKLPVGVSLLPATWGRYGDELTQLCRRYPELFGEVSADAAISYYTPPSYHAGSFTDPWGCVWSNVREGYESIVTGHPLARREDVRTFHAPKEDCGLPHGFMFLRRGNCTQQLAEFLQNLPAEFNRQGYLAAARKLGIPDKTAEKHIDKLIRQSALERWAHNQYRKVI